MDREQDPLGMWMWRKAGGVHVDLVNNSGVQWPKVHGTLLVPKKNSTMEAIN